jgi:predicted MPP superfamily phosphohydrolase
VKKIEVSINNLPKVWIGKKIVQISDVHLGHIYHYDYMLEVAKKINALEPDVIVITGDLFDGTDGHIDVFVEPLNLLKASRGIFYASGNHETYLGVGKTFEVLGRTKITCLRNEVKVVDGLQFVGIDYPAPNEKISVAATIKKIADFKASEPSVLLWHMPSQIAKIRKLGISLMLSGHTHKGQLFPFGIVTRLMFGGYDYGLKKKGNFSIHTSCGLGAWGTPMRTEKHSEIVEITLAKG